MFWIIYWYNSYCTKLDQCLYNVDHVRSIGVFLEWRFELSFTVFISSRIKYTDFIAASDHNRRVQEMCGGVLCKIYITHCGYLLLFTQIMFNIDI